MKIRNGIICIYHSFDVGKEIHLGKVEKLLGAVPKTSPLVLKKITPRYVQYRQPPLLVSLGSTRIKIGEKVFDAKTVAKIYDFGVITVVNRMPFSGDLRGLRETSALIWSELPAIEKSAAAVVERIKQEISGFVMNPAEETFSEDYVVYQVNRFDRPAGAEELVRKYAGEITSILASEPRGLSTQEVKETFKKSISYSGEDLLVTSWNAAFVYDTEECYDTLDVLEYANIELLELRVYDSFLDKGLDKAYDHIRKPEHVFGSKYSGVSKELSEMRLDVSEVMEKVENSLKLVGEQYLARVHESASSALHLGAWKEMVNRKLGLVQDLYALLSEQIQMTQLIILEVLVIALIAAELALALWK
ncbi:MAG: hypothetical protein NTY90_03745 [Candidatus Micrarchaeota archaeon]|nr:hypothetical protein [Candidatus Micrarchaeota archaeon]